MIDDRGMERFVKDPKLLIELCRKVVEHLIPNSEHGSVAEKEAQLREISRSIERLEKIGVPIPDALRAEKTRLAAALSIQTEVSPSLNLLVEGLEALLHELKVRIGKGPKPNPRGGSQTTRDALIPYLLDSLTELGGSAHCSDVLGRMERKLQGRFLQGDLEHDDTHGVKWKHNAHFARLKLANDGILIKDSPRGYWQFAKRPK